MQRVLLFLLVTISSSFIYAQTKEETGFPPKQGIPNLNSTLQYFIAKPVDEHILINWATVNAVDNNFFTIERSTDFENFESIRRVNGSVKNSATVNYEIVDYAPFTGVSYYRLRLTDFDGKHSYSDIPSVLLSSPLNLLILRNGTSKNYILDFKTTKEKEDNYIVEITNALGQSVYKETLPAFCGKYNREVDLVGYGKTAYLITISNSTEKIVKRVVAY